MPVASAPLRKFRRASSRPAYGSVAFGGPYSRAGAGGCGAGGRRRTYRGCRRARRCALCGGRRTADRGAGPHGTGRQIGRLRGAIPWSGRRRRRPRGIRRGVPGLIRQRGGRGRCRDRRWPCAGGGSGRRTRGAGLRKRIIRSGLRERSADGRRDKERQSKSRVLRGHPFLHRCALCFVNAL